MKVLNNPQALLLPAFLQEIEKMAAISNDLRELGVFLLPGSSRTKEVAVELVLGSGLVAGGQPVSTATFSVCRIESSTIEVVLQGTYCGVVAQPRRMQIKGNYSGLAAYAREIAGLLLVYLTHGQWVPEKNWIATANRQTYGTAE